MSIQRLQAGDFLQLCREKVVIDVRSPGEYEHAHMPGAANLPLFTNEERKLVGTAYKQEGRQQAIKIGLDIFGPRMKKMVEAVEALIEKQASMNAEVANEADKPIFIYCWRGGMRSGAVAWLLDLYGFQVNVLAGGYKSYRNLVLSSFEEPYRLRILGGFTGSGKTEVIQELKRKGERAIDLEEIASHKGSAFGSYKMKPQPTQEMFENLLSRELQSWNGPDFSAIWLEDESQRIGNINLPNALWKNMRQSPLYFLDIPFERRLDHLTEEYKDCDTEKLIDSVQRISKRLGPVEAKNTISFLEQGEFKEAFRILLHYYDKHYLKGMHNREQLSALLNRIESDTIGPENALLLTKYHPA